MATRWAWSTEMIIYPALNDRTAEDLKELIRLARKQLGITKRWEKAQALRAQKPAPEH